MNHSRQRNSIRLLTAIALLLLFCSISQADKTAAPASGVLAGKEIAMIISFDQFKDSELLVPKKLFEAEGAMVTIASSRIGMAKGTDGTTIKSELPFTSLKITIFDAVVFVGGQGCSAYWHNPVAHGIAQETVRQGKILGAICWAPIILANAGVLKEKKATVFNSGKEAVILQEKGCSFTGEAVTKDGHIITANGPLAAEPFAKSIIGALAER